MRAFRHLFLDIDRQLEDAARAKQQLDAERWRAELRPRAMRQFAARTAKLTWSRALLKLVVAELFPDDLFTELVGNLDRAAPALAPRHRDRRRAPPQLATRRSLARRQTAPHLHRHEPIARTIATTARPTITTPILRLASAPSRRVAPLRPRAARLRP
jgi:hypothetical protein